MTTPPRIALLTSITSIVSAVMLAFPASTYAASIIWGLPTGISGDTDVSTDGTLVGAFNLGDSGVSPTTVNTVLFQSFAVPNGSTSPVTVGNFTLAPGSGVSFFSSNTQGGFGAPPFNTLSANYQTLLAAFGDATTGGVDTMTLTMSGLTVGGQYQFEWWSNASNFPPVLTTATAGGAVTLSSNPTGATGGLGQYALGTFTADALTETITFSGPGNVLLNGFQLRDITAVPEPSTWAMLAIGATSLLGFRRRSPRQV